MLLIYKNLVMVFSVYLIIFFLYTAGVRPGHFLLISCTISQGYSTFVCSQNFLPLIIEKKTYKIQTRGRAPGTNKSGKALSYLFTKSNTFGYLCWNYIMTRSEFLPVLDLQGLNMLQTRFDGCIFYNDAWIRYVILCICLLTYFIINFCLVFVDKFLNMWLLY